MNKGALLCSLSVALFSTTVLGRADANPDFDDDAKPILRMQPGLISYVRSHFEVKDTGKAKYPGDDDRRPEPPYIFRARPIGSHGPFNIRLLIEPGPPGHILCVVPPAGPGPQQPAPSGAPEAPPAGYAQEPPSQEPQQAPSPYQPQEAQTPYQSPTLSQGDIKPLPPESSSQPAPATAPQPAPEQSQPGAPSSPSEPTADTPSGPIIPNSSSGTANPQQNLAPPPDPGPSNQ